MRILLLIAAIVSCSLGAFAENENTNGANKGTYNWRDLVSDHVNLSDLVEGDRIGIEDINEFIEYEGKSMILKVIAYTSLEQVKGWVHRTRDGKSAVRPANMITENFEAMKKESGDAVCKKIGLSESTLVVAYKNPEVSHDLQYFLDYRVASDSVKIIGNTAFKFDPYDIGNKFTASGAYLKHVVCKK